jgi:hypothetical protein
VKERTPLVAVMALMDPSSLVHEPKLLVLLDHLEKSSIMSAALQAAEAPLTRPAARPIKVNVRILENEK